MRAPRTSAEARPARQFRSSGSLPVSVSVGACASRLRCGTVARRRPARAVRPRACAAWHSRRPAPGPLAASQLSHSCRRSLQGQHARRRRRHRRRRGAPPPHGLHQWRAQARRRPTGVPPLGVLAVHVGPRCPARRAPRRRTGSADKAWQPPSGECSATPPCHAVGAVPVSVTAAERRWCGGSWRRGSCRWSPPGERDARGACGRTDRRHACARA